MLKSNPEAHSFLKQCLHDLQLAQFGSTFTKPFKLISAEKFGEIATKWSQVKIVQKNSLDDALICFRDLVTFKTNIASDKFTYTNLKIPACSFSYIKHVIKYVDNFD